MVALTAQGQDALTLRLQSSDESCGYERVAVSVWTRHGLPEMGTYLKPSI